MTRSRQTADWGSRAGLAKVIPSSVAVGSGTGSADSLGTVTFSGASSVSLNNCFSSTYKNYRVVLDITSISAVDSILGFRLRVSGSDDTSANYVSISQFLNQTGGSGSFSTTSGTLGYLANMDAGNTYHAYGAVFDMLNPISAIPTIIIRQGMGVQQDGTTFQATIGNIFHNVSTAYDSLTILTSSTTTLTGTISVYGYN